VHDGELKRALKPPHPAPHKRPQSIHGTSQKEEANRVAVLACSRARSRRHGSSRGFFWGAARSSHSARKPQSGRKKTAHPPHRNPTPNTPPVQLKAPASMRVSGNGRKLAALVRRMGR
jgi:hypothetical protein